MTTWPDVILGLIIVIGGLGIWVLPDAIEDWLKTRVKIAEANARAEEAKLERAKLKHDNRYINPPA